MAISRISLTSDSTPSQPHRLAPPVPTALPGEGGSQGRGLLPGHQAGHRTPPSPTLRERLALPQPPHGLRPPVEHADALRDQVSAGLGSSPRCWQGGASGLGSWLLREGQGDAHSPAWLLSAELAQSSQEHLQRTVKYGGRRRLPSPGEMQAFLVLGVQAGQFSRIPSGWQELGPLSRVH